MRELTIKLPSMHWARIRNLLMQQDNQVHYGEAIEVITEALRLDDTHAHTKDSAIAEEAPDDLVCPHCKDRDELVSDGERWYCEGCDGEDPNTDVYTDATAVSKDG